MATVQRRRLILSSSSILPWVYPNALAQVDFVNSRAYVGKVPYYTESGIKALFGTFSTPAHIATGSDGKLVSIAANAIDCFSMAAGTCLGQLTEEARTNKSTNYNAQPQVLVAPTTLALFNLAGVTNVTASGGDANSKYGVVNDSASMTGMLSGLLAGGTLNGRVFVIDNTAGLVNASFQIGGLTGNTNGQTISVIWRGTGTGRNRLNGTNTGDVTLPSVYTRNVAANVTPSSSSNSHLIQALPGAIVYFILNGMEEGSFATSPIIIAGASATRAASSIVAADGPSLASSFQQAKAMFFRTQGITGGTSPRMIDFGGGANAQFSSSTVARLTNGTNNADATLGAGNYSGIVNAAFGMDATSLTSKANGGSVATSANAWSGNTGAVNFGNRAAGDRAENGFLALMVAGSVKDGYQRYAVAP